MRFGRYELLSQLGAGGMGEVWRGRDHDLHRDVALKFLPEKFAGDPNRFGRFTQEALAASKLNHPNIVTIHDVGETSGLHYIVMELVEGETLRAILLAHGERPLSARRLLEMGAQIADGLAKAHAAGIVHRDLKPENVMVTSDGFVKILDFGLVKLLSEPSGGSERWFDSAAPTWPESPSPQTAIGAVLGTVGYMSPEQARGRPIDYRSDQFALGAILYEMATGRQAFRRETPAQTIAAIIDSTPEPLATLNPARPPPARWVIERCLAKEPAERYASTVDLARELRNVRERLPEVDSSGSSPYGVVSSSFRRSWKRTAATGLVAFAILALVWGAWELSKRFGPTAPGRVPVVAVLPLTNLTGQEEYDATAVGIAEVLVSSLAEIQGIQVLSRPSTTAYRDRKGDLPAIARQLDASYLVDGVLQRSEEHLRVSFSLIRSSSNVVEWSGTFDGAFPQLFDLQSRVADGVANALRLSVTPAERAKIEARPTASPSAWEEYTTALALLDRPEKAGNATAAVAHLESALRADPRFAKARGALARACLAQYEQTSDPLWAERARDEMTEALRLDPRDADVREDLARLYMNTGKIPEAIEEARKALEARPRADHLHRLVANLLVETGDFEGALTEARRAVALREWHQNHYTLGYVLYRARRFEECAAAFRRATELQPDNAWAFQALGAALHEAGHATEAEAAYKKAIAVDPGAASMAWASLGTLHYESDRAPEAVEAFRKALELEPASGVMHRNLGDALARQSRAEEARAEWREGVARSASALRVNSRQVTDLVNAAICRAKLGESAAALEAVATALEVAPRDREALSGAAAVHALVGDPAKGLQYLEQALAAGESPTRAARNDDFAKLRPLPGYPALMARYAPRKGG
jgi:serine/threonine protein kinase/TolB-like protein/Tfp pilus assembly protein PilF